MPTRPKVFHPRGGTPASRAKDADQRRGSARARGYTTRWDKAAKAYLREHPLCAYCALNDRVAAATCVDHLYPHLGDMALFWITDWWVSSCASCHSGFKQTIERAGRAALDALARRLGRPLRP